VETLNCEYQQLIFVLYCRYDTAEIYIKQSHL